MANRKPPYYISAQHIADLMQIDIRSASVRLSAIRKYFNKRPAALVSLAEYAEYEQTSLAKLEDYFMRTQGLYIPPEEGNKKSNPLRKVV